MFKFVFSRGFEDFVPLSYSFQRYKQSAVVGSLFLLYGRFLDQLSLSLSHPSIQVTCVLKFLMCSDERFFGFFFCINFTGCQNSLFKLEIVFQLWVIFLYYFFPNSLPFRYFSFCNSFIWTLNLSPETFFLTFLSFPFFLGDLALFPTYEVKKIFFLLAVF